MRESATTKARRYLSEGKVTVLNAQPDRVSAVVVGSTGNWATTYRHGNWECDCPAVRTCSTR